MACQIITAVLKIGITTDFTFQIGAGTAGADNVAVSIGEIDSYSFTMPFNLALHKFTSNNPHLIVYGGRKEAIKFLNKLNSIWVSAEVFNLLDIDNTVSYLWVADVSGRQYAVPNYLTPRQLNFKLIVSF